MASNLPHQLGGVTVAVFGVEAPCAGHSVIQWADEGRVVCETDHVCMDEKQRIAGDAEGPSRGSRRASDGSAKYRPVAARRLIDAAPTPNRCESIVALDRLFADPFSSHQHTSIRDIFIQSNLQATDRRHLHFIYL